ncbi:DUF2780 domain-containing protein [Parasalinivibrio latis]|uniref:DUF2780 domain-containing protein n=1 Tax=Parasalinivibrio latis TaxID=2952610 RepID=UPI0030E38DC7
MRKHFAKTSACAVLALALPFTSLPSYAFSLDDLGGIVKEVAGSSEQAQASSPLVSALTDQVKGLSGEQAVGGAGALLALAQNSLGGEQKNELGKLIPGMDSLMSAIPGGLGDTIKNMDTVNSVCNMLGIDPALVAQLAPVALQFLGQQGASQGLLSSLGSLWQVEK